MEKRDLCKANKGVKVPFDFFPLPDNEQIKKDFQGYTKGLVKSIPEGWIFGQPYVEHAENIYNMELREDDVWIVTYPKSGTTWMQHIVWFLLNNLNYNVTSRIDERSPFIDFDMCIPKEKFRDELVAKKERLLKEDPNDPLLALINQELAFLTTTGYEDAENLSEQTPRLLKSHLPFSLLPPDILFKNKIVYVARDPRDVVVSYFHHHRLIRHHEFIGDFKTFFHYFIQDKVLWSPYWRHISQAWTHRESKNLLFVFFSDMKEDLSDVVDQVCSFLQVSLTEKEKGTLLDQLNINNMKGNIAIDDTELMVQLGLFKANEGSFILKGKSGGWKEYFDDEMMQEMEEWKERNCKLFDVPIEKLWK